MKAFVLQDWGLDHLRLVDRPAPEPAAGEVALRIRAVSINPRDRILCLGGYGRRGGATPLTPLCDGAGEVAAIGDDVSGFAIGDLAIPAFSRTWLSGPFREEAMLGAHGGPIDGVAQEIFTAPAAALVKAPAHLSPAEAATLPCAAATAWNAVVAQGGVSAGQRVLVQGTGGVSLFALQFAKMLGAEVIATSSSDERLETARALGADHLINYRTTPDWAAAARDAAAGEGVDHVVDVGGAGGLDASIRAVRAGGAISLIGVLSGAEGAIHLGRVVTRNIRLQGVTVGSREMLADMVRAMALHEMRPTLDPDRFDFDDLPAALAALPEGRHVGKVVATL